MDSEAYRRTDLSCGSEKTEQETENIAKTCENHRKNIINIGPKLTE